MKKRKKQPTLSKRVVLAWMVALFISNLAIGILSCSLYRNQLLDARANEAQNVAVSMAVRVDGDKFTEIMQTLEKNDYWHEIKNYADNISRVFNTAFIYILDSKYTDVVTYFAEGAPDDSPYDLGMTEIIEDVYADEMFDTIRTGESRTTEPYPSGEYGDMVSGFAAITNKNGNVVGVVGVDFYYGDIERALTNFALTITAITIGFLLFFYFTMSYLGNKLAGIPLTTLDKTARKLSVGDMDVSYNINSKSEIGRLAKSFTAMIEGIKSQAKILEVLSQGDLTPHLVPRGEKDVMGHAIVKIMDNLNDIFVEINQSAMQVSTGARQLSDNAQGLALGASEQAAAVERLSASISEVSDKSSQNLSVASKTNALAASIMKDAQTGSDYMNKMTTAVRDISDSSTSISKVIKVIDDIAFQTNILALNAAVEAARAGTHGKGFAVVAEEVRNLAAKSAEAAKDTERLILDSMDKTKLGASIAEDTASSLARIISGINECASLVDTITHSFDEQITAMSKITSDVEQVSRVVLNNSAAAEESAAASEEMSGQASILEELVSGFKLRNN